MVLEDLDVERAQVKIKKAQLKRFARFTPVICKLIFWEYKMRQNIDEMVSSIALNNRDSDTNRIKARIKEVVSDIDLLKKTLLASGIYDKNFKLTKNFK